MTMGLALLIWPALAEPETHSPDTLDLDWYLLDRGDSRARERLAHAAVTAAPDSAAAHRAASYILAREDHSGETLRIEMYRRWVEETPDQPAARVGLAETLFWSDRDNSERCEAVQAALDHIGDSDPRARFEALQLAWMAGGVSSTSNPELACTEIDRHEVRDEIIRLGRTSDDLTMQMAGAVAEFQTNQLAEDEVPRLSALLDAKPSRRVDSLAMAAFDDELDRRDPTVRKVRAALNERIQRWGASDDPVWVYYASEVARRAGDKKTQARLEARVEDLDPRQRDSGSWSDLKRTIYEAAGPTYAASLDRLDALDDRLPPTGADRAYWHSRRSTTLWRLDRKDEAYAAQREAYRADPTQYLKARAFADWAAQRGEDLEEALEAVEGALASLDEVTVENETILSLWCTDFGRTRARHEMTRGWVLHKLGRTEEALVALRRANQLHDTWSRPMARLGLVLYEADQRNEAFRWLTAALTRHDALENRPPLRSTCYQALEELWPEQQRYHRGGLDGWLQDQKSIEARAEDASSQDAEPRESHPLVGLAWPMPQARSIRGGDTELRAPEGGLLVVDAWATWCGPCIAGMPYLDEVAEEYADQGVRVVGLSTDEDRNAVKRYLRGAELPAYELAWSDNAWSTLQLRGIPSLFIIDDEGTVLLHKLGPSEDLRGVLDGLLADAGDAE